MPRSLSVEPLQSRVDGLARSIQHRGYLGSFLSGIQHSVQFAVFFGSPSGCWTLHKDFGRLVRFELSTLIQFKPLVAGLDSDRRGGGSVGECKPSPSPARAGRKDGARREIGPGVAPRTAEQSNAISVVRQVDLVSIVAEISGSGMDVLLWRPCCSTAGAISVWSDDLRWLARMVKTRPVED